MKQIIQKHPLVTHYLHALLFIWFITFFVLLVIEDINILIKVKVVYLKKTKSLLNHWCSFWNPRLQRSLSSTQNPYDPFVQITWFSMALYFKKEPKNKKNINRINAVGWVREKKPRSVHYPAYLMIIYKINELSINFW